jgi:hypothetical protein
MSTKQTGVQDRHDQSKAPGELPSFIEIARGFGVTIGPSLLLVLFAAGSTLAVITGWIVRSKRRTARMSVNSLTVRDRLSAASVSARTTPESAT